MGWCKAHASANSFAHIMVAQLRTHVYAPRAGRRRWLVPNVFEATQQLQPTLEARSVFVKDYAEM